MTQFRPEADEQRGRQREQRRYDPVQARGAARFAGVPAVSPLNKSIVAVLLRLDLGAIARAAATPARCTAP
jgi:hypothetical protein